MTMGSIGADLAQRRWGMQRIDGVLRRAGCLLGLLGVYVAFFSSTLLTSLTYVLVVGLLSAPVIRLHVDPAAAAKLALPVQTGLSTIRRTATAHSETFQPPTPGRSPRRAGNRRRRL